jgi:hypothetical protein
MFTYALTGWEGSAADAQIYHNAVNTDLVIPEGWYYLGDAGSPHCNQLLVSFGVSDTILQNGDDLQHGRFYLLFFLIHLTIKPGLKTNMNYSTSGMPKDEMSSSVFSVYSNNVFGFYFLHHNTPLKFNHVFQQHWLRFIISSEFMIHKQRHTLPESDHAPGEFYAGDDSLIPAGTDDVDIEEEQISEATMQ